MLDVILCGIESIEWPSQRDSVRFQVDLPIVLAVLAVLQGGEWSTVDGDDT